MMNKNWIHKNCMNTLLFTFSIILLQLVPQNFICMFIYCSHILIYIQQLLFAHFYLIWDVSFYTILNKHAIAKNVGFSFVFYLFVLIVL